MNRNAVCCLVACVVLLGLSGCVRESVEGTTHTYANELWVPLSLFFGGVAGAVGGWFLRKKTDRVAWAMIIGGTLAVLASPATYLDRVIVSDSAMNVRVGLWVFSDPIEVEYENLRDVRLIVEESRGRRGRKNHSYFLMCSQKDGETVKIPVNNDVAEAAVQLFVDRISELGIPFVNVAGD